MDAPMFNQTQADSLLEIPGSTMRDYASRIGLKPDQAGRAKQWSIGDLVLIQMAVDLVGRGYKPRLATALVFEMKSEFHRLVVDEGRNASAWLFFRPAFVDEKEIEVEIYRDAEAAWAAMDAAPDATILPIHSLLRGAMNAVLAGVGSHA